MRILKNIWKNETVCCIAFFPAVFSAFLVTPDGEYFAYPDYRTIALLFCLMIIVAGFQSKGVFARMGHFSFAQGQDYPDGVRSDGPVVVP